MVKSVFHQLAKWWGKYFFMWHESGTKHQSITGRSIRAASVLCLHRLFSGTVLSEGNLCFGITYYTTSTHIQMGKIDIWALDMYLKQVTYKPNSGLLQLNWEKRISFISYVDEQIKNCTASGWGKNGMLLSARIHGEFCGSTLQLADTSDLFSSSRRLDNR